MILKEKTTDNRMVIGDNRMVIGDNRMVIGDNRMVIGDNLKGTEGPSRLYNSFQ